MADVDIEEVMTLHLLATPAVAALVADRVIPLLIPLDAPRPAIAYQRVSTPEREDAHDGPLGPATARIQLTCEGRTYAEAKALARAVRRSLRAYRGLMGSGATVLEVFSTRVSNDVDGYSEAAQAPVVRLDVFIQFREES